MGLNVYIGMCYTSHDSNAMGMAVFEDPSITYLFQDFESPIESTPLALACLTCPECPEAEEGVVDPIYGFSGEYYKSVVDMRIPGRGLDFIWARKYRSRIGPNTEQGNGWDFSYNIKIEKDSDNLILFDGNTRRDRFARQPDGTWTANGFCWEFIQDLDGTVKMMCSDTGTWHFHPFNHPCAGRISKISDRNGNTITFEYDTQCRLVTIHDTLDTEAHNRDFTIAYNDDGFIESVTDFIGRQVRYEYYQDGDAGGSFGDLKSVTTPAVTGTPNCNNFPQGKTTVYTYSKGFADKQLNHNLLTITDPKGQIYLTNIYAPTQDRDELNFDRVVRQIWGNPYDIIDITYVPQIPSGQNNFAIIKTIVNDRAGNVKEYFHDSLNQLVAQKEYTGQADPNQPTTETQNRPTGKLRPKDPAFFETRWQYNADYRPTRIDYPNGNFTINVYELDLNPNAPRRSRCNLREVHYLPGPLESLSDPNEIVEYYEYDTSMGGCCGTNFVTRHINGRGNEILHQYDDRGNRLRTTHRIPSIVEDWEYNQFGQMTKHILPDNGSNHRRVDLYIYYSNVSIADLNGDGIVDFLDLSIFFSAALVANSLVDIFPPRGDGMVDERDFREFLSLWLTSSDPNSYNPQNGYLKNVIIDAANFALTTTYEYDPVGNITRIIDPRGNDSQTTYNQLNQVVREISSEVTNPNGVRYEKDIYYDKNDNVVRTDVQNIDDQDLPQANTHFTTIYEYDVLDNLIRQCEEVGNYIGPIPGLPELPTCTGLPKSEFITTEYEYDANRNRILICYGEAVEGRQPTNIVRTLYDERDLLFREIRAESDPDQSTIQYDYDGNGNVLRTMEGLENIPSITSNIFDGYDRLVSSTDPMGNVTTYHYDENGNQISLIIDGELTDDDLNGFSNFCLSETTYVYDAMDRLIRTEVAFFDPNTQTSIGDGLVVTEIQYSDNSQVIRITNDNNHSEDTIYDSANRVLEVIDAKGNVVTYDYDENSNVTSITEVEKSDLGNPDEVFVTTYAYDGLNRPVQSFDNVGNTFTFAYDSRDNQTVMIDALDHETRYEYNGINRLTATVRDLDGDGADGDGDDITTSQGWDDTSRLIEQTDNNGNTTSYAYDALDRLTITTYADGTQYSSTYDVHDNAVQQVDCSSSMITSTYDLNNRLIRNEIASGHGVSNDTTFENYAYDGLSRLIYTEDDDSLLTRCYDSLSNMTLEILNGRTMTCLYDGVGNQIQSVYPGGRVITCTYDELERKKTISDTNGTIATYDYIGSGRIERREHGNGTRTDYTYDGISDIPNPPGDFGVKRIIRTTHSKIVGGSIIDDRIYTWDRMYNKTQRKDVRAGGPQLTHDYTYDNIYRLIHTTVTDNFASVVRNTDYALDGVGNRISVASSPNPGPYTMDPTTPNPADYQMNQYTRTSFDNRLYDDNGNLITIDCNQPTEKIFTYDYRDRMVKYTDISSGQVHNYAYDTIGRRIKKIIDAAGTPQTTRYFYDDWQVVEEQNSLGATQATYVYGLYIDEVLNMRRSSTDYYYHPDDLYCVMAVTDSTGTVRERYEYADYGSPVDPTILTPVSANPSVLGNPYLFQGRRLDPETGLYYFRNRYYDSRAGRFLQRDLVWDEANTGNQYSYAGNGPLSNLDPMGLWSPSAHDKFFDDLYYHYPNLSKTDRNILKKESCKLDKETASKHDMQHVHAMDLLCRSKKVTKKMIKDWIDKNFNKAVAAEKAKKHSEAMKYLALALHTIHDKYSPEHTDNGEPKTWVGVWWPCNWWHSPCDYWGDETKEDLTKKLRRKVFRESKEFLEKFLDEVKKQNKPKPKKTNKKKQKMIITPVKGKNVAGGSDYWQSLEPW